MSCKKTSIGGQALIEGIMMRGPEKTVMAVRKRDGSIETSPMQSSIFKKKPAVAKWPVIRGVVNFVESMLVGYKAMMESAEKSGYLDEALEEEKAEKAEAVTTESAEAETAEPETAEPETADTAEEPKEEKKTDTKALMGVITVIASVLAVILSVGLFIYLPSLAFKGVNYLAGGNLAPYQAVFEGVLKILIFLGYMLAVSQMKDIKRVFRFHGAEHKTIFCYEAGLPLTVENVREQRRFHPRCGTSFLILMLIVSIAVTLLLDFIAPGLKEILWLRTIIKLLIVPIICGLGYELIKFCGRHENIITKIVSAPGLWLQRITVLEPDDAMIEVAIAAMTEVIPENSEADNW